MATRNAFDAMMAEIESSDSDDGRGRNSKPIAQAKQSQTAAIQRRAATNEVDMRAAPKPAAGPAAGYKMSKEEESIAAFGSQQSITEVQAQSEQLLMLKRWLMRPCPPGADPLLCYVERDKGSFGTLHPTYRCFQEGNDGAPGKFLMAAKKKASSKTSYYLISLDRDPDDRGSDSVLGKVRGNTVGSQYLIVDHGLAPEKTAAPSMLRKEFGIIQFEFDSGGPSKIGAWVPSVSTGGLATTWQPASEEESIEASVERNEFDRLIGLQNKRPKWDEAHGGHVLNFQGRVTESSVKNFQLCAVDSASGLGDDVLLQFGRVDKNKFSMDVRYPLSPFQAFAMCVACMDGKLADRKGYEFMRKLTGSVDAAAATDEKSNIEGSLEGGKGFGSSLRQALPSTQYLKDKFARTFK